MNRPSLSELQAALRAGKTTVAAVLEAHLSAIEARNGELNVFLEVYAAEARACAAEVQAKIEAGTAGSLAGLIVGLKDVICHKDHGLQAASQMLDGFESQFNATAVERLLAADAIVIGRQNCDEFAMGSSNKHSSFGPTRNAADPSRVPGGSSGASAVGVQAGMCQVSLGSDTGGSVRLPASFCGVYGLKPTYGRISRYGLIAYASSFDSIGVFAHHPEDVAAVLEVIAGADEYDSTVSQQPVPSYTTASEIGQPLRVGVLKRAVDGKGMQPEVHAAYLDAIEKVKADGHSVEVYEFPLLEATLPTYYILTAAEASSNLSRYDGVRYGHRSEKAIDVSSLYKASRSEGFGAEVQRRIMLGTFVLSAGYFDAYYGKAQKVRRLIQQATVELFDRFDFLLLPTAATTAFALDSTPAEDEDPLAEYLTDLFTVQANLAGIPGLSMPWGLDNSGLPIGLQLLGPAFSESQLLSVSRRLRTFSQELTV